MLSRNAFHPLWKFGPSTRPLALMLLGIGVLLLATATWSPIPMEYLFREPYSIGHIPLYVGLISNIGALLWCCTIGICLMSYFPGIFDPSVVHLLRIALRRHGLWFVSPPAFSIP